jgi:hypothetical protein
MPVAGGRVFHHFHDNAHVASRWQPGQEVAPGGRSQKVCQLTGDIDFQNRHETANRTDQRFHVAGTDLGYPFEHDGRLYLLFGDTHGSTGDGRDSLAFTRETDPEACPRLDFVADGGTFLPVQAPGVSLAYFEVPTTGFSGNDAMYAFAWTNHRDLFQPDANGQPTFSDPVGHAALLRSDDNGRSFRLVWDRLGDKLVYLAAAVVENADIPGLPQRRGRGVLLWGSGRMYRGSPVHLAYVPLDRVEQKEAVLYYAGLERRTRQPRWSSEPQARALFEGGSCVGELSVTWNRNLRQWLMLYNCGPRGTVVGRLADAPWGPWSEPAVLFDSEVDPGSCHFVHRPGCGPPSDPVSPGHGGPGGTYAPFAIPRYTKGGANATTVYYALSTWNPYQVVLMRSTLRVASPLPYGPDTCRPGFVWREAVPDDHVCVPPATRDAVRDQNRQADRNRSPTGGEYGPDTCAFGLVWRDAFPGDHVCVTGEQRALAAQDNAQAAARRLVP